MTELSKYHEILNSTRDCLSFHYTSDNVLETKSNSLLGFIVTVAVGYATLVLPHLSDVKYTEGIIGLVVLALATVACLWLVWPRKYSSSMVNIHEHMDYFSKTEEVLLLQLISDTQAAIEKNKNKTKNKILVYKVAMLFFIVGAALFIFSLMPKFYA